MLRPLILNRDEMECKSTIPNKTTVIVVTCQSRIECLMWAVFSLLLRSNSFLEHIIVTINGADKRTGDPSLQDKKQHFLEDLRNTRWVYGEHDRDMPLTVQRTWSRIGHSQAIDAMIPWVHTRYYTLMHDDIIVNTPAWCAQTLESLVDEQTCMVYATPLLGTGLSYVAFNESKKLNLPHLNSMFLTTRKSLYTSMGVRWYGYHVVKKFRLDQEVDMEDFLKFHQDSTIHMPPPDDYGYLSMDVGTHVYHEMKKAGYKFAPLAGGTVTHLTAMSWRDPGGQELTISQNRATIDQLISEIKSVPTFKRLYEKYAN